MRTPTLLFINGPVASGKSTIAQRYIQDHRLALIASSDDFVGSMGQWLDNEDEARALAFKYLLLIAEKHLQAGFDVVVPFLLIKPDDAQALENIAKQAGARFVECTLIQDREQAVRRAVARGSWGEPNSPPLTEKDRPIVERLFDEFERALPARPHMARIQVVEGDIDNTYTAIKHHLEQIS